MTSRRLPALVVGAWSFAALVVAGLGVAIARALGDSGVDSHMRGMDGMGASTADALARGGASSPTVALSGARLVTAWQLDAVAVAILVLLAAAYLTGVALVPTRSPGATWPRARTLSFLLGLGVCAFATCGSIAVYDQVLFTAHMAGHLALVMVAPALIAAGRPLGLAVAAAPSARRARLLRAARGRVVAALTAPPTALAAYAAVIVGSHLTGLMDVIMRSTWAGQLEHLVYLLVGYQFFVLVVGDEPIRWRLGSPARWLLLAVAMAVDTITGIVLMQGTVAVRLMPSSLGVSALSDTRTGGAIMWLAGDAIMAAIMIASVVRWLRAVDTAPPEHGWLEQARGATFAAHTGRQDPGLAIDSDEDARAAYNSWLAELERR